MTILSPPPSNYDHKRKVVNIYDRKTFFRRSFLVIPFLGITLILSLILVYGFVLVFNPRLYFKSVLDYFYNVTPKYTSYPSLRLNNNHQYELSWKVYVPSWEVEGTGPPLKMDFWYNGRQMEVSNSMDDVNVYMVQWKNENVHGKYSIRVRIEKWRDYYYWWKFYYNDRVSTSIRTEKISHEFLEEERKNDHSPNKDVGKDAQLSDPLPNDFVHRPSGNKHKPDPEVDRTDRPISDSTNDIAKDTHSEYDTSDSSSTVVDDSFDALNQNEHFNNPKPYSNKIRRSKNRSRKAVITARRNSRHRDRKPISRNEINRKHRLSNRIHPRGRKRFSHNARQENLSNLFFLQNVARLNPRGRRKNTRSAWQCLKNDFRCRTQPNQIRHSKEMVYPTGFGSPFKVEAIRSHNQQIQFQSNQQLQLYLLNQQIIPKQTQQVLPFIKHQHHLMSPREMPFFNSFLQVLHANLVQLQIMQLHQYLLQQFLQMTKQNGLPFPKSPRLLIGQPIPSIGYRMRKEIPVSDYVPLSPLTPLSPWEIRSY